MSRNYDNWERLVDAVLRREQMWQLFHQDSRSTSICSEASGSNLSSFKYSSSSLDNSYLEFSASSPYLLQPNLVFFQDISPAFDFMDLMNASTKLLGNGTFRSAYLKAKNNGIKTVVKKIKLASMSEAQFKRHMEIVGNIRHENLVPLRAYFYSKDETRLLYDRYSNGSVHTFLQGRTPAYQTILYWEIRLRILLGAARGIAHIHKQHGRNLVHGNIKASNILLDSEEYGIVSEFGLANIISTTFPENAQYSAPEVKSTQDVSQASDVYSFGILLLELLTKDSPVQAISSHKASLVMWVYSVKRKDWNSKLFAVDLRKYPAINEQMVKMLQIGLRCVAKEPKKRPIMSAVAKMIEDVRMMGTGNSPCMYLGQKKLVFLDGLDHGFDIDDLKVSSAENLGQGKFWASYKVILNNGTSLVMKRLKELYMPDEELLQHIKLIGSLRHENIGELKAYYWWKDERILVYDYYIHENLTAKIRGKLGGGRSNLGWKERLRGALGAARGISYIHTQVGNKLVHGNIKASNLFFNSQWYGCITDVGLPMLKSQFTVPVWESADHRAPELAHTKTVSQASDVYSFGVLLLQLVSGKPDRLVILGTAGSSLVRWLQSFKREEWTRRVFDPEIVKPENNEEIERLFRIGLICVAFNPEKRPKMTQVVQMLEDFIGINT